MSKINRMLQIMIIVTVTVYICSGCNNEGDEKSDEIITLENRLLRVIEDNAQLFEELEEKDKAIEDASSENQVLKDLIDELKSKYVNTKSELDLLNESNDRNSHILPLTTGKWVKLNEFVTVIEECPIYAYPDEGHDGFGIIYPQDQLKVLEYVLDKNWEEWALVRDQFAAQIGDYSVGYVKAENLANLGDEYNQLENLQIPDFEVEGIRVGDSIEKVISVLGHDYSFEGDDYWFGIAYGNLIFSLVMDNSQQKVYEINLRQSTYRGDVELPQTYEFHGFRAGEKASEVFDYFDEMYEEYVENKELLSEDPNLMFIEFDVNDDYVIHVKLSDNEIDDETTIEGIGLIRKYWVY